MDEVRVSTWSRGAEVGSARQARPDRDQRTRPVPGPGRPDALGRAALRAAQAL